MLRTVFGTHRNTKHHGKAKLACRHRLPFGKLIEDLVTGAADEVGIHQLDQCPPAGKRIAYRRRYNRRLGDR